MQGRDGNEEPCHRDENTRERERQLVAVEDNQDERTQNGRANNANTHDNKTGEASTRDALTLAVEPSCLTDRTITTIKYYFKALRAVRRALESIGSIESLMN